MRLKIVQAGEAVLRSKARALTATEIAGDEIQRLIRDMRDTMRDAPGVGLAAPQVGLPLQLAVIEDKEEYLKRHPAGRIGRARKAARPISSDRQSRDHRSLRENRRLLRRMPEPRGIFRRRSARVTACAWSVSMSMGSPGQSKRPAGMRESCSMKSIIFSATSISTACAPERSCRSKTSHGSGRESRLPRSAASWNKG